MDEINHHEFPAELIEKQEMEAVARMLGFVEGSPGLERSFDGLGFTICESIGCHFIIRDGRVEKRTAWPPRELRVFSPMAPIELMATIYRMWAEVSEGQMPKDSCLCWGKNWLDYQKELKRLIPPPPTLWAEREFLRHCLNYIDQNCDWTEKDYEIRFSQTPGQLRIAANNIELFCPARGNWIGEVSISAKELFRNLTKRFLGPAVILQIEADKLRIDNRMLRKRPAVTVFS